MEQVLGKKLVTASCNRLCAPVAQSRGWRTPPTSLRMFRGVGSLALTGALSTSSLEEENVSASVRLLKGKSGGSFVGLGEPSAQRRTFVRNCVAAWLVMCTASMADTARGEPSGMGSDAATTPGTLVFYNYPLAFNPAKSKLALEEKGLKYVEKKIDLFNGQSLEPWYLRLNPNASSPTLVAGKEVITESVEIIKWVDRQGPPLGGDKVDRTFISEWLQKVDSWDGNLFVAGNSPAGAALILSTKFKIKVAEANIKRNPELTDLYKQKIASMETVIAEPNDAVKVESNRKQLVGLLDEAEARLAKSKFLAGEQYSAADAIFTPVIYRLFLVKKDKEFLDPRTNLKRYYEVLKQRPSYNAVFGVSDSGLLTAGTVLPAVGKILFSQVTGRY